MCVLNLGPLVGVFFLPLGAFTRVTLFICVHVVISSLGFFNFLYVVVSMCSLQTPRLVKCYWPNVPFLKS
jgi:hypothetical protein